MNDAPLLSTRDDAVLTLTLNRPESLNALSGELVLELWEALDRAGRDCEVRAVILTGAGRAFSAGGDLNSILRADHSRFAEQMEREVSPLVLAMRRLPKPIVVAVNGIAFGAGMGLALAGDIILAGRSARFAQVFAGIGLVPDTGCTWTLPRLIGEARARAMMLTTDPVAAEEAQRFGFVWEVVEDANLVERSQALAAKLARMPTLAFARMKGALEASASSTLEQQLSHEALAQQACLATEDFKEGVAAFMNKRKPVFVGR